ncbi:thioredoxin family protein [bacterium]|nr:thioredoxin family protein [bacterium]
MKKNIIVIALIFIVPIIAYAVLSQNQTVSAAKYTEGQPQVIKFSSKLCADCKKLKTCFDELKPRYENKINFIEYDVESTEQEISDAIDKYGISLVPTLIFVDKNGKEKRRTEGFVEKNTLESHYNELLK